MSETDVRINDFLNDKLQTFADFETLDALIDRNKTQHELLLQQLREAEDDLRSTRQATGEHATVLQRQIDDFQSQQNDIDLRLQRVTRSDGSGDALHKFEILVEDLGKLEMATGYIEILHEVEHLQQDARRNLSRSPESALQSYGMLRRYLTAVKSLQTSAEGAAPHLCDHIDQTIAQLRMEMKTTFTADFEAILSKILWPKPSIAIPDSLLLDWNRALARLLELQKHELLPVRAAGLREPLQHAVLFPLQVMVKPLEQRFRYHFDGDRPTNKLDKPEYFLSHAMDLFNTYSPFVIDYVQPSILLQFGGTELAEASAYIDATSALITSILPMLLNKIEKSLPQVAKQPQVLSHYLHEIMSFDATLRDEWQYSPVTNKSWRGLTYEILVTHSWFDHWLEIEKNFALTRYQSIVDTPDAGELDYDTVEPSCTKPTKAAIRVNDLLESVTERYRPLSSFSQKLRFLIDIQINIFDRFYQRLHSALEAFRSKTSSLGRTMQGVTPEELASLKGPEGLDRICRIYGSADYLERAMRDWSDDVFFLDLWIELQIRAQRHDDQNFAGSLTVKDVAERTSAAVGSTEQKEVDTGALFDETAASYRRLRVRSETLLVERLVSELRDSLRPYYRNNLWSASSSSSDSNNVESPSVDLASTLSFLGSSFSFLRKALGPFPLRRVARQVAISLEEHLWDRVLMGHSFSSAGAAQFVVDVAALEGIIDRFIGAEQGRFALRRVYAGAVLLSLPAIKQSEQDFDGQSHSNTNRVDAADENDAWEAPDDLMSNAQLESAGPNLWSVEKRVFQDNESARELLEEMGLDAITENEARQVLQRRIELAS